MAVKQKSYVVALFEPDGVTYVHTDAISIEAAKQECKSAQFEYVDTELVILPKGHHHDNPISHTLAKETGFRPRTAFIGAIEKADLRRKCAVVNRHWEVNIRKIRTRMNHYRKPSRRPNFDNLPSTLQERIKIRTNGCRLWFNVRAKRVIKWRYGTIKFRGKTWQAHRLVYTLLVGKIPKGGFLMHQCDTPACVNPDHLLAVSPKRNFDDMVSKGRAAWQS